MLYKFNRKPNDTPQARTRAASNCNPTWSVQHSNNLLLVPGEEGQNKVRVAVWNQCLLSDDLIGEVELPLNYSDLQNKRTNTTKLNTGGEVELRLGWKNAGCTKGQHRQGTKQVGALTCFGHFTLFLRSGK